ncbi:hypothetical protein [Secundilactobacillus folii]|uniref:Uncharacterized protein n=1 Tax=Secundilactobacillus folii TaxID=2678357 RepID=A0A7X2XT63_9LACO|nr:hypothetical protein [Secundilactobacillus folii]MTV81129.1 hypothetical protein [Secundilactobacillus folii]
MHSDLAYQIQDLASFAPVTAFCFDRDTCYVAQTDEQDTIITPCRLKPKQYLAVADNQMSFRLQQLSRVNSLSLVHGAPKLTVVVSGQPVTKTGEVGLPEFRWITIDLNSQQPTPRSFRVTHLEAANITGTPLPKPVIGSVSALSSDGHELALLVLDQSQHLQATIYDVRKMAHLIWQLTNHDVRDMQGGDLHIMATAYQSFKPTAKQLAPETIGSIQSIAFSNGRALYATKSHGDQRAISKGFWLLKNGFHDLSLDDVSQEATLTGIQLQGEAVYFVVAQPADDGKTNNQIRQVSKSNWN